VGRGWVPHDSRVIANHIIAVADSRQQSMDLMTLLKLAYFSHGHALAIRGEPLSWHAVKAWKYGPVIPEVYFAFRRRQGVYDLKKISQFNQEIEAWCHDVISDTYRKYEDVHPLDMSDITHVLDGPWDLTVREKGYNSTISDEIIGRHFEQQILAEIFDD